VPTVNSWDRQFLPPQEGLPDPLRALATETSVFSSLFPLAQDLPLG
jgi:hypothetical protein